MTEQLDSRALRHTDTYGQRFMKPGTYPYAILPAAGPAYDVDHPWVIEVVEKVDDARAMAQCDVSIAVTDRGFRPNQEVVTVEAGDLVLWHCPEATSRPFVVRGEKEFFASDTLSTECGYSHVFTTPGEHVWVDAHGSGLRGVVRVSDPKVESKRQFGAWQRQLREGTLVYIADGRPEPAEVEVTVGQTVFFAIVTGQGVSITAQALLEEGKPLDVSATVTRHLAGAAFFR